MVQEDWESWPAGESTWPDNDSLAFPNEHRRGENSSHWSANNSLTNESVATNQLIFSPLFDTFLAVPEWYESRIEEGSKVVNAVWGTGFIHFLAELQ